MDRDDLKDLSILLLGVVALIAGLLYGGTYLICSTYAESKYDVTINVQAVEHSNRFYPHTNVYGLVYGDQDITYNLYDYHDFRVGRTYHIVFINKLRFTLIGFNIYGEVQLKEESP